MYTAHIYHAYLIVQVYSGEIGETVVGQKLSCGIGQESGQIAAGYAEAAVRRTVNTRSAEGEVGEEITFVTLCGVARAFRLLGGGRHLFIVFQRHFPALLQGKRLLCGDTGREQQRG